MKNYKLIKLITPEKCNELISNLQTSTEWEEGAKTTSALLQPIKHNQELDFCELFREVVDETIPLLLQNKVVYEFTLLDRFITMLISRTGVGGGYGGHYDSPFMMDGELKRLQRTDYSFTIFLNDDFEGGNLIIEGQTVKPKQGYVCIYPSTMYHQVTKVLTNERYACVGWMQSQIQDPQIREAIKLLHLTEKKLDKETDFYSTNYRNLQKVSQILWTKFL